jgi:hypothetical protein
MTMARWLRTALVASAALVGFHNDCVMGEGVEYKSREEVLVVANTV